MNRSMLWVSVLAALLPCAAAFALPQEEKKVHRQWTDLISEEEFKALHELKEGEAPPLRGESIELSTGDAAYLSLPKDAAEGKRLPGILVIHEWWGLNSHIKHWADRLAAAGYAALAVDLYGGKVSTTPDESMKLMQGVEDEKALRTLLAAHDLLESHAKIRAERTASIGWCFGGGWSLKLALAEPDLDLAVIYYGRLETDPEALKKIRATVVGVFGNQDRGIAPATVDAFEKGLNDAGVTNHIHRYDANHAFANPSSARYDQESATDAWEKVQGYLRKILMPGEK